jgi:hypothetical protein
MPHPGVTEAGRELRVGAAQANRIDLNIVEKAVRFFKLWPTKRLRQRTK